jgi:hypothetical protein
MWISPKNVNNYCKQLDFSQLSLGPNVKNYRFEFCLNTDFHSLNKQKTGDLIFN